MPNLVRICPVLILILVHRLPLRPECKCMKRKLRRMKLEWNMKIKEEVVNHLEAGPLEVTDYTEWLPNRVLVLKKVGKVRMYVEY